MVVGVKVKKVTNYDSNNCRYKRKLSGEPSGNIAFFLLGMKVAAGRTLITLRCLEAKITGVQIRKPSCMI